MNWENEYLINMFGPLHDIVSMDKAAHIKYDNMPESLFKYRRFEDKTIDALHKGVLFSSPPSRLNDPREVPVYIDTQKIMGKSLQSIYNYYRISHPDIPEREVHSFLDIEDIFFEVFGDPSDMYPEFYEEYPDYDKKSIISISEAFCSNYIDCIKESAKQRYNICSFTGDLFSSPMWSHYSGDHSGFCIEYNFKGLGMTNDYVQLLLPVLYRDKSFEIEDINVIDPSFCMFAFTVKDIAWKYENEWRLFSGYSEKPVALQMPTPKAVYAGMRIDRGQDLERLKSICSEIKVPLFQIEDSSKGVVVGEQYV